MVSAGCSASTGRPPEGARGRFRGPELRWVARRGALLVPGLGLAIVGLVAGVVEGIVRALQHDYYFATAFSFWSFLLVPGAVYAVVGMVGGVAGALVLVLARRPHAAATTLGLGAAFAIILYWRSMFHGPFPGTSGNAVGHTAMALAALAALVLVRRAARAALCGPSHVRRRVLRWAGLAVAAILFAACVGGWGVLSAVRGWGRQVGLTVGPPRRPLNIVLITIDTLRADHLGCYGYPATRSPRGDRLGTSPTLDRLAAQGARFESAIVTEIATDPSHASILTSLYPVQHGVTRNAVKLTSTVGTLAEVLSAAGYRTAAAVSVEHLDGCPSGMSQGFQTYFDRGWHDRYRYHVGWRSLPSSVERDVFAHTRAADRTDEKVIRWLSRSARRPFFLWVHYFDPHRPYESHEQPGLVFDMAAWRKLRSLSGRASARIESTAVRLYDSEIRFVDDAVRELLRAIEDVGALDETLVVVTADHGEHMSEARLPRELWFGHSEVYEETARVPLIVWRPGVVKPGVYACQVSSMDIAPTILDIVGVIDPREGTEGRSLLPLIADGEWVERPLVVTSNPHAGLDTRALRAGRWKVIVGQGGRTELFDLVSDPAETLNLAHEQPGRTSELSELLAQIVQSWGEEPEYAAPDEATLEMLRALGYVQ